LVKLRRLCEQLTLQHRFVLFELCFLLLEFDRHSAQSNMNISNLSIVFTPNLFRLPEVDMLRDIKDAPFFLNITKMLLDDFAIIFQPQIRLKLVEAPSAFLASFLLPPPLPPGWPGGSATPDFQPLEKLLDLVHVELALPSSFDICQPLTAADVPASPDGNTWLGHLFDSSSSPAELGSVAHDPSPAHEQLIMELLSLTF
jgi:hypothetical protein